MRLRRKIDLGLNHKPIGENDFIFTLMSTSFNPNDIPVFPKGFHIGFLVDTKEEVIQQYNKMKDGNVTLEEPKI